ncbi:MAG: hypothetical protein HZC38_18935 [Chloroflexi bacterium]|nr:hypothetical protein [Chloroflexota bacterium]MBI5715480.1 hypothetical protein [Chloroflexota bacterium]
MSASDPLQNSPELPEKDGGGIKASYLLDLPPQQRRIMRLLLRHAELTLVDLRKALDALPEDERLTSDEIDNAIKALIEQNWLIRLEANNVVSYKANFQRGSEKPGLRRRSASPIARDVWDALEAKDKNELR